MHNTVEDTPLLHTELPDDYLYISFGDGVCGLAPIGRT